MTLNIPFDEMRQRLEGFLIRQTGKNTILDRAEPLAGGASRDMWLIEITVEGVHQKLVLRRDPPTTMSEQALTRAQEFTVMQAAYERGVRVAQPRWLCEDDSVLGGAFFLMDYVEGIAIGRKVVQVPELAQARQVLPEQMAEQLALIHTLDTFDFLPRPPEGVSPAQDIIHQCYAVLDRLEVHNPAFELALRWADRHAPPREMLTFVHGDFRIGNLIVNPKGLAAVADWEFAHVGDPLEDLGFPCMRDWRFGMGKLRLGGISEREPFLLAYERYSGRKVEREAVDYWEFLGNLRWAVICLAQANRHLSGRESSVELASLGRRSAEMQMEMLRLMRQIGI
jgi:aminoglycoside phosphotransferase (APT) family kinase protein